MAHAEDHLRPNAPDRPHSYSNRRQKKLSSQWTAPANQNLQNLPAAAPHDHSHAAHQHGSGASRNRLAIALGLTSIIVIAQLIGSIITGSLALLTDTAHAVVDASGLVVALIAASMMRRPAGPRRTWGYARMEAIAALAQSALLIGVGSYAVIEGVQRLIHPPEVPGQEMLIFGVVGLVSNVLAILVLAGGRGASLNMKAAFLEVLNDALGSLGVIVAAIVIKTTGYARADAIAGLLIAGLIVPRAVAIMQQTLRILMEFTPREVDLDEVRRHLLDLDHVEDVHDLHASMIGTGLPIISAHVVVSEQCFYSAHALEILADINQCLRTHFPIAFEHSTIQLETRRFRAEEGLDIMHA